ncbi:Hypothetical predicted protein, partial [Marmota monax]
MSALTYTPPLQLSHRSYLINHSLSPAEREGLLALEFVPGPGNAIFESLEAASSRRPSSGGPRRLAPRAR